MRHDGERTTLPLWHQTGLGTQPRQGHRAGSAICRARCRITAPSIAQYLIRGDARRETSGSLDEPDLWFQTLFHRDVRDEGKADQSFEKRKLVNSEAS